MGILFGQDLKNMEEGFREGYRQFFAFVLGFVFSLLVIFLLLDCVKLII